MLRTKGDTYESALHAVSSTIERCVRFHATLQTLICHSNLYIFYSHTLFDAPSIIKKTGNSNKSSNCHQQNCSNITSDWTEYMRNVTWQVMKTETAINKCVGIVRDRKRQLQWTNSDGSLQNGPECPEMDENVPKCPRMCDTRGINPFRFGPLRLAPPRSLDPRPVSVIYYYTLYSTYQRVR